MLYDPPALLSSGFPAALLLVATLLACSPPDPPRPAPPPAPPALAAERLAAIDQAVQKVMTEVPLPGLAVAITRGQQLIWSQGWGMANIEKQVAMTPDTLLNVASISKTITAAAIAQLWEAGRIDLDDDVNTLLPFTLRHPSHPEVAITVHQLLTHTSGLDDGPSYDKSYACGDPSITLRQWIEGYVTPGGTFFDAANFLATGPGESYSYSNVAYGVLGLIAEIVSGQPFEELTRERVFKPLSMQPTAWHLRDLDLARHALPYDHYEAGQTIDNPLALGFGSEEPVVETGFVANCLYSFPNYPDGLVRTSVNALARFLLAHVGGGELDGMRILKSETVAQIWSGQLPEGLAAKPESGNLQGLAWRGRQSETLGFVWSHGGADPGVRTQMLYRPEDGVGVIIFTNKFVGKELQPLLVELFASV